MVEDPPEFSKGHTGRGFVNLVRDAEYIAKHLDQDVEVLPTIKGRMFEDVSFGALRAAGGAVHMVHALDRIVKAWKGNALAVELFAAVPTNRFRLSSWHEGVEDTCTVVARNTAHAFHFTQNDAR